MLYIYMLAHTTTFVFNTWYLCPNHAYQAFHIFRKYAMRSMVMNFIVLNHT